MTHIQSSEDKFDLLEEPHIEIYLGTIQILRNQKGGWVGKAKCLRFLTRWLGGCGKMLT